MNNAMLLCKQFMKKHSFILNADLRKVKFDLIADMTLKTATEKLATLAGLLEYSCKVHDDVRVRRVQLMVEELSEVIFGLSERDEELTLDGLSDLRFVTDGTALAFDLPLEAGVLEVCKSNLTKATRQLGNERLRDKGPDYVMPNMKRVLSHYQGIEVKAIRTRCIGDAPGFGITVLIKQKYHHELDSRWIYISKGGVTGYESIEEKRVNERIEDGWCACVGTKGRWDELFLPAESMKQIQEWLKQ